MFYKAFLDTNIYDGSNYSFRNAAFTTLKSRAKNNELELQIDSIIRGEVEEHTKRKENVMF